MCRRLDGGVKRRTVSHFLISCLGAMYKRTFGLCQRSGKQQGEVVELSEKRCGRMQTFLVMRSPKRRIERRSCSFCKGNPWGGIKLKRRLSSICEQSDGPGA